MAQNRFSAKHKNSVLGQIVDKEIYQTETLLNAIDFLESPTGPNVNLYPVQRVVYKAILGVPMDYREVKVPVWNKYRDVLLYTFTEREYLKYVYEEGRCNIGDWQSLPQHGYNEADLIVGRRGGKSALVSGISAYKLYRLLSLRSPQEYYGLISGSPIDVTFIAQDDNGSSRLYAKLREDVNRSAFFTPYIKTNTDSEMNFVTESDRLKRDATPTVSVVYYPCSSNASRGPSSYILGLDELAHFRADKRSNSDEIYASATPSTMQFVATDTGRLESLILSITSPMKKSGKAYELHKLAMEEGPTSSVFTLRCSTAEMNPRSDASFLKKQEKTAPITWPAEWGGQFLDSTESYVKNANFDSCVLKDKRNVRSFDPIFVGKKYFWGFDLGMEHDASALAISHFEIIDNKGICLVYDYIGRMMVGEEFDGIGVAKVQESQKYISYTALSLDDIILWIVAMNEILPCYKGATDQHGGQMLVQLLQIHGITGLDLMHITTAINSKMAYVLKGFIDQGRVIFPDEPKFIREFKNVEAEVINKYQIRVAAPPEKDSHDDMVDATAISALIAQKWLEDEGHLLMDPSGSSIATDQIVRSAANALVDVSIIPMAQLQVLDRQYRLSQRFDGGIKNPYTRQGRR